MPRLNVKALLKGFINLGLAIGLQPKSLGTIGEYPFVLMQPENINKPRKLLIAAAFHGEEPGGCLGLLEFLFTCRREFLHDVSLSLLPVINPTGLSMHQRENIWGENPNRGFCDEFKSEKPSREGKILLDNLSLLTDLGRDGFLSLHEDDTFDKCYLYVFENRAIPGSFSMALRDATTKHFPLIADGPTNRLGKGIAKDGIVFRCTDGSFEDKMFREGIPRTACTETPGKADLEKRINANADIVKAFINFVQ